MITSDKIEIYMKFNGDDDIWVRAASKAVGHVIPPPGLMQ